MSEAHLQRRFCVRDPHEASNRAHVVEGLTFEDAALHFLDDHHPADDEGEVRLYVEDVETGERQCLCIDLESGRTEACA